MRQNLYCVVLSIVAMVGSVFWLRWTHDDIYFLAFLGALTLFVVSSGDYLENRWGVGRTGVPASAHVLYCVVLSIVAMVGSVLWLRWTNNGMYFIAFLGALTLFVVSSGDYLKNRWGIGRTGVPASVHVLAFSSFAFGVYAGVYGIGNPAYSFLDLAVPPFFMAGCVYAAYLLVGFGRTD